MLRFLSATSRGVGGEEPQKEGKAAFLNDSSASPPPSPSADDPPTPKQLNFFKRHKMSIPVDLTKAMATELIGKKLEAKKE